MALASKTFRIFVSSTFSDLKQERNALQKKVFPELRKLCMQFGFRFQAIDLRWGVSEKASLSHETMRICLKEIERCQCVTPRPNFLVLLGDRYGWEPIPEEIPSDEFTGIKQVINENKQEFTDNASDLLEKWYKEDENAVPSVYVLQPVGQEEDIEKNWDNQVQRPLLKILRKAVKKLNLSDEEKLKYIASATHQEVVNGAMKVEDADEHVFGFFRSIENLDDVKKELLDKSASDFVDIDSEGKFDESAHHKLKSEKKDLEEKLGKDNIFSYKVRYEQNKITMDHLDKLCEDVFKSLSKVIKDEAEKTEQIDDLEKEIDDHVAFGIDRASFFIGRVKILNDIKQYVKSTNNHPLVIYGESGSGKSALMARAFEQAQENFHQAGNTIRFIGATPTSSDIRSLLENICRQIPRIYGADENDLPNDFKDLVEEFPKRLALATKDKPLVIFLDALDQLSDFHNAKNLTWLPLELPPHVHMVVSLLPGESLKVIENKLAQEMRIELGPMTDDEAEELLDLWLKDAGRTLQKNQREEVIGKYQHTKLVLYLQMAFEYARQWHSYTEDIEFNPEIEGLIQDFFTRLSADANHGEMIVSRSLGYIAAGKNGLSEDELIDLLSNDIDLYSWFLKNAHHIPSDVMVFLKEYIKKHDKTYLRQREKDKKKINEIKAEKWFYEKIKKDKKKLKAFLTSAFKESHFFRIPIVLWSRLYFDLEPYIIERSADGTSLMTFYHPTTFGHEVKKKYLFGKIKTQRHHHLAKYFENQELYIKKEHEKDYNIRKLSELPYQLTYSEQWEKLKNTLTEPEFWESKSQALYNGIDDLILDFHRALKYIKKTDKDNLTSFIKLFNDLLNQIWSEASVLRQYPELIIQQLWNRLHWNKDIPHLIKNSFKEYFYQKRSSGQLMLLALVPQLGKTDEDIQTLKFNEKIINLTICNNGLIALDRKGQWYLINSEGKTINEGKITAESIKQVQSAGKYCVTLSGSFLSLWKQWPDDEPFLFQTGWPVSAIDINNSGHLLTVGQTGDWVMYDFSGLKPSRKYQGKINSKTISGAISSDGNFWAIGDENGQLELFKAGESHIIKSQKKPIKLLNFSKNNALLLSLMSDGSLSIYNMEGETLFNFTEFFITHAEFNSFPDSIIAVTSTGETLNIFIKDQHWTFELISKSSDYLHWVSHFPDNGPVVTFNDEGFIRLLRADKSIQHYPVYDFKLPQEEGVGLVHQNKNCYIIAGKNGQFWKYCYEEKPRIELIHDEKKPLKTLLDLHSNFALAVYLNQPHSYCAKIGIIPDFEPPKNFWPAETFESYKYSLMFSQISPHGNFLIIGSRTVSSSSFKQPKKTKIEILETQTFKKIHIKWTEGWWTSATISDTGILAICEEGEEDSLRIYNKDLQLQGNCNISGGEPLSFDSEGKILLAIDRNLTSWLFREPWDCNCKFQIQRNIRTGTLSDDGKMILLIDKDGFIHIFKNESSDNWDIQRITGFPLNWVPEFHYINFKRFEINLTGKGGFQILKWQ